MMLQLIPMLHQCIFVSTIFCTFLYPISPFLYLLTTFVYNPPNFSLPTLFYPNQSAFFTSPLYTPFQAVWTFSATGPYQPTRHPTLPATAPPPCPTRPSTPPHPARHSSPTLPHQARHPLPPGPPPCPPPHPLFLYPSPGPLLSLRTPFLSLRTPFFLRLSQHPTPFSLPCPLLSLSQFSLIRTARMNHPHTRWPGLLAQAAKPTKRHLRHKSASQSCANIPLVTGRSWVAARIWPSSFSNACHHVPNNTKSSS